MVRRHRFDHHWKNASPEDLVLYKTLADESEHYEVLAIGALKARHRIKEDFEEWADNKFHDAATPWKSRNILQLLLDYISQRTHRTLPRADREDLGATYITWGTLRQWRECLVWNIARHVTNGETWLIDGNYTRIFKHCAYLVEKFDLERIPPEKDYCGIYEIRLVLEYWFSQPGNLEWKLQMALAFAIFFTTGVRPSSLGVAYKEWVDRGIYMKIRHLKLTREGFGNAHLDLSLVVLKGFNVPPYPPSSLTSMFRERRNIRGVTQAINVICDVPLLATLLLIERGATYYATYDEYLADDAYELKIRPEFLDKPAFCRRLRDGSCDHDYPIRSDALSQCLRTVGRGIGMPRLGPTCFRRDLIDDVAARLGDSKAVKVAVHSSAKTTNKHYSRGAANIDLTGLRNGEELHDREALNMHDQPALRPGVGLPVANVQALKDIAKKAPPPAKNAQASSSKAPLKRQADDDDDDDDDEDSPVVKQLRKDLPPDFVANVVSEDNVLADTEYQNFLATSPAILRHQAAEERAKTELEAVVGEISCRGNRTAVATKVKGRPDAAHLLALFTEYQDARKKWTALVRKKKTAVRNRLQGWPAKTTEEEKRSFLKNRARDTRPQTLTDRLKKKQKLEEPSLLLEGALAYARPNEDPRTRKPAAPTTVRVADDETAEDDDYASLPSAPAVLDLAEFVEQDVAFEEAEIRDVSEMDVNLVRICHARMLLDTQGKLGPVHCLHCARDPTVASGDARAKLYKPFDLVKHQNQFHTIAAQVWRWYNTGGIYPQHKHTCFLCWWDGEPTEKFSRRDSLYYHINSSSAHADDDRTNDGSWVRQARDKIEVVLPEEIVDEPVQDAFLVLEAETEMFDAVTPAYRDLLRAQRYDFTFEILRPELLVLLNSDKPLIKDKLMVPLVRYEYE